ncbi:MAG: NAD(P)-dependent oxidoreductase [Deltaproteobacteria bacterium]|nr:NAD(P)-dependent oxidoreductase [Deltaproteobacteria bacterium]
MLAPLVVLFGGAGYIGSVLARRLLLENFRVRIVDNFLFGNSGIREIASNPQLEIVSADICDTHALSSATKGADVVVLLAAIIGRRKEPVERADMRDINFLASSVVLDAALEHGASRFIFASTDSVYGLQSGVIYETTTPEPVSLYSRLKLRMEERVINADSRYFHTTALRISTCHGYSPRMRFDLVANTFIRDAFFKNEIRVEGGNQYRSFVHVDDVARAFTSCIKAHANLISGEVFNIGSHGQSVQIKHLANIVKTLKPEINVLFEEAEVDMSDYYLSCSKANKILDFSPAWTLERSLQEVLTSLEAGEFPDAYNFKYYNIKDCISLK